LSSTATRVRGRPIAWISARYISPGTPKNANACKTSINGAHSRKTSTRTDAARCRVLCACSIHCCAMFLVIGKCAHANVCAADNEGARLCVLPAQTRRGVRIGPQGKQAASADGAGDAFSGKVSAAAPVLVCALGAASRACRAAAPLPSNVAISSAWSGAGGRANLSGSASASYQRRENARA